MEKFQALITVNGCGQSKFNQTGWFREREEKRKGRRKREEREYIKYMYTYDVVINILQLTCATVSTPLEEK